MAEEAERHAFLAHIGPHDAARLFKRFARYTRFVLVSKWFLGAFALVLMASLVVWPMVSKDKSGMRITFTGTEDKIVPAVSPSMDNPVYEGTDAKGQRYKITGTRAIQQTATLVVMENPEGQLLGNDGKWTSLTADRADYDQEKDTILLTGNVTLVSDSGTSFVTDEALFDTNSMDVRGTKEIAGEGGWGDLLATGFEILDNGNRIRFGGGGRVTVHLAKSE